MTSPVIADISRYSFRTPSPVAGGGTVRAVDLPRGSIVADEEKRFEAVAEPGDEPRWDGTYVPESFDIIPCIGLGADDARIDQMLSAGATVRRIGKAE